ncbi:MAG: hypothetical protein WCG27_04320 [Pseudomonadota bacterium]
MRYKGIMSDKKNLGLSIILALSFALFLPLIISDPLSGFDDPKVVVSLEKVSGLGGYLEIFKKHQLLDIQPIRDFSLWLDWQVKKLTGIGTFHATNWVIWGFILFFFHSLLKQLPLSPLWHFFFLGLYAFNPSFVHAVGWASARKHLLSTFFILWATYLLFKHQESIKHLNKISLRLMALLIILYLLSCFSQPINVLWPLWVGLFFLYSRPKGFLPLMVILGLIALGVLGINYHYYTQIFPLQTHGIDKFVTNQADHSTIAFFFLAIGRYFLQLTFPYWPSPVPIGPGSSPNIVGLFIFPLVTYFFWKRVPRDKFALWGLYFLFPLLTVVVKTTQIFVMNTYLINAAVGFYLLLAMAIVKNIKKRWLNHAFFLTLSVAILLPWIIISWQQTKTWQSNFYFWKNAYQMEPITITQYAYAKELMNNKQADQAYPLVIGLFADGYLDPELPLLLAKSIFYHSQLQIPDKIKQLQVLMQKNDLEKSPWINYYLAGAYAQIPNWPSAYKILKDATINKEIFIQAMQRDLETILIELVFYCQKVPQNAPMACWEEAKDLKKLVPQGTWRENFWQKRAKELNLTPPPLY